MTARVSRAFPWLVVAGVLVAALSLRGPIVAPAPVLREIEADLGVGSATVALLTTAPVLMFAVLTPLAALVIRRAGPELALLLSLCGVLAGSVVRAVPGFAWMMAGMIVIGAAITVGNVVIPVVIRRDVPGDRVGIVTAAYVAMLNAGSLLTSLLTAPLAAVVGWPLALLLWSVVTVAGLGVWGTHLARSRGRDDRFSGEPAPPGRVDLDARTLTGPMPAVGVVGQGSMLRHPVVWLLALAFAGQAFMYYGLTTWLPALSGDVLGVDRAAAGAIASVFQGVAVVGAFVVPLLTRVGPPQVGAGVVAGSWIVLAGGMLLAPELMWVWLVFGAVAHAGGFVVIFTVLVQVARSDGEAAGMSALVQGTGYALGALAGPLFGALFELTGSWTPVLAVVGGMAVAYAVFLFAALTAAGRR